jgi:hypothetical protein
MGRTLPSVTALANLTPARELAIPVEPALTRLFPDAGMRRGHVIGCTGDAAMSIACALVVRATAAGAWLAVVGVPDFGIEAAIELGVAPERVVAIAASDATEWADRITVAADGFELILTEPPRGGERVMRKLRQRLLARGCVLVIVCREHRALGVDHDVGIATTVEEWVGIGHGNGRLEARRVAVRSSGRRVPRPVTVECWLPGPDGRIDVVQTGRSEELFVSDDRSDPPVDLEFDVDARAS